MKKAIQIDYNEKFEKKCKYAAESGFDGISVNFSGMVDKSQYEWDCAVEDIQTILEHYKLECCQTHPYYYDLRVSSEITEDRYEYAIIQAIIASGKLGASWCALHPRSSVSSGFRVSRSFEDNVNKVNEYLEYAHKYNVGIGIENLPIFLDVIPIMPFYSSNYEDLCELADNFNDEKVGICWDTGHANLMDFDQADAIRYLGQRIKCTHIHNNFKNVDNHFPPTIGNIPWNKVMGAFDEIGYKGYLTLETHCFYPEDDTELRNFARYNFEGLEFLESIAK